MVLCAVGLTVLVAAVTRIASSETQTRRVGWWRWTPAIVVAAWLGTLMVLLPPPVIGAWTLIAPLAAAAVAWMAYGGHALEGEPPPHRVQAMIGWFIGGLVLARRRWRCTA